MADLDELERLEKAATPGPWEGPWGDTHTVAAFEGELNEHSLTNDPRGGAFPVTQETQPNDAALIAAMRNALPELLARLRAAESKAETLYGIAMNAAAWLAQNRTDGEALNRHESEMLDERMCVKALAIRAAIDAARGKP